MSMSTALAPPQPRAFCATIVRDAEVTVVGLAGEIDLFAADALEQALAATRQDAAGILVDLTACSFFGSTGLNALAKAGREARRRLVPFAVVAPPGGACRFVLDLGIGDVRGLVDDRSHGLRALRSVACVPGSEDVAPTVGDERRQAPAGG